MQANKVSEIKSRIKTVNRIVQTLGPGFQFSYEATVGLYFEWESRTHRGKIIRRRWTANNGYPSFYKQLGYGGTVANALTQLALYCQSRSHLPIGAWEHWASDSVMLWKDKETAQKMLGILRGSSYSKPQNCVLCGKPVEGKWEWGLSLNGTSEGVRHRGSEDTPYPCV